MSSVTCSNSNPHVSMRPAMRAQNMNASSGSGLWPSRTRTARTLPAASRVTSPEPARLYAGRDGEAGAERRDPGLPQGDLQARRLGRPGDGDGALACGGRLATVREHDAEEARRPRPARAPAVPRGAADARRGKRSRSRSSATHGRWSSTSPGRARCARRQRPRRGRPARAPPLGGARGADRRGAGLPDARPARRPDPGQEPRVAGANARARNVTKASRACNRHRLEEP